MIAPVDWTGVREIHERAKRTPGHPMCKGTTATDIRNALAALEAQRARNLAIINSGRS